MTRLPAPVWNGNPTTGYSWPLTAPPGNQVRLIDEDYTPASAEQVGSGGVQRRRV